MLLGTFLVAAAHAADPTAEKPAAGAAGTGGKVPKEEWAREPLAASEQSIAIERNRGNTNIPEPPMPCEKETGKPCQMNADCECTGFCYFNKGGDSLSGKCEKYNRLIHAA